jgi:hypothetical protein
MQATASTRTQARCQKRMLVALHMQPEQCKLRQKTQTMTH